jgi:hypothetical protein
MKSLNVRLTADDAQRVHQLKKAGVSISDLVREAIAREAGRHREHSKPPKAREFLRALFERFPAPENERGGSRRRVARAARSRDLLREHLKADHSRIQLDYLRRHKPAGRAG